ncbi:MAG: uridine kinase [Verrucomicrobiota bacterium]
MRTHQLEQVVDAIALARARVPSQRSLLIGISGIDASGKGFVTEKLTREIEARGWNVAAVGADGWLNLPHVRFDAENPAAHFYDHAFRFDEMFERLVLPLRNTRGIDLEADFVEETATTFRKHRYEFHDVDIILLEGIFLLQPAHRDHFDLKVWIDCSFETALQRAVARGQEGLPPAETIHAFETIYFPAQRIHLARDNPRETSDVVFPNESQSPPKS